MVTGNLEQVSTDVNASLHVKINLAFEHSINENGFIIAHSKAFSYVWRACYFIYWQHSYQLSIPNIIYIFFVHNLYNSLI